MHFKFISFNNSGIQKQNFNDERKGKDNFHQTPLKFRKLLRYMYVTYRLHIVYGSIRIIIIIFLLENIKMS